MGYGLRWLIGDQQLHDHVARLDRPFRVGSNIHARRWLTYARGGEGAFALDVDHASTAVAVGMVAGLRGVA